MDFCSYNTRGLNNKISFYKDFIASNKIGLVALSETHVKQESASFVCKLVAPRFSWVFNYECHPDGRLWLGWDPNVWNISGIQIHAQHISCQVTSVQQHFTFFASFIYAVNDYVERRLLWNDLILFKNSLDENAPWVLSGDFNV